MEPFTNDVINKGEREIWKSLKIMTVDDQGLHHKGRSADYDLWMAMIVVYGKQYFFQINIRTSFVLHMSFIYIFIWNIGFNILLDFHIRLCSY